MDTTDDSTDKRDRSRVFGPHPVPHRPGRWRLIVQRADGTRATLTYASESAAQLEADQLRQGLAGRTAGQALTAYMDAQRADGVRQTTIDTETTRLIKFLRLDERDLPLPLRSRDVARMFHQRGEGVAPKTHRETLACARRWSAWCVKKGWFPECPFQDLEGKKGKGRKKPQLRLDEGSAFIRAALRTRTPLGLAAALALLTGARASEIMQRQVRDVDGGGTLLYIPDGEEGSEDAKTQAARRFLRIPRKLQPAFRELTQGRAPRDWLWPRPERSGDRKAPSTRGHLTRWDLYRFVKALSTELGVPVSPHGLRGTFSTITVEIGGATDQIAKAMGHADGGNVARRSYLGRGAEQRRDGQRAEERLLSDGGDHDVQDAEIVANEADFQPIPYCF